MFLKFSTYPFLFNLTNSIPTNGNNKSVIMGLVELMIGNHPFPGICISIIFLIICISTLLIKIQRMKLEKEKQRFYDQNGGHILYQKIISGQVNTVEIFTEEVLKNANNNFECGQ